MTKILLIEDETSVRENLIDLLEAEDYEVVCTENGFLGLLWAFEHLPDLIICDVMMPEINGHEVLRALRQDPATAKIPYIFLTALSEKNDIRQGMELGADDYLTKPYTRSDLLNAISVRLARREVFNQTVPESKQSLHSLPGHPEQQSSPSQYRTPNMLLSIQDDLEPINDLQDHTERAIAKIQVAMDLLKTLETEEQRDCCLSILKDACAQDLQKIQEMGYSLVPE